ncbi:Crp/Fnr family transcriptional regulator [Terrihabitans sp. B22-R8]|uniref:Crp/Fnr family transcriptional regulator n=1 Tax=Terrihabitans sp. B22-R8 TaxID=3425128 RepID=UPI00403C1832
MSAIDRTIISGLPIFSGLDEKGLTHLLEQARPVRAARNTPIFEEGEHAHSFFVLVQGHVRAVKLTSDGAQVVMRYLGPGEIFGVAIAIGRDTYPATALAVVDSLALAWPSSTWPRLSQLYPNLVTQTLHKIGERLQDAQTRMVEISTQEVERRVAHALLRLAEQAGRDVEGGIEIIFPISRQDVAEMTATTLHTVSRILSSWDNQGLVAGGRQRIVLRDLPKLRHLANAPEAPLG